MFIIKFVNNNNVSTFINVSIFYANKELHSHMSFNLNIIDYFITRQCLDAIKTKNIIDYIKDIFIFIRDKLNKTQLFIIK